MNMKMSCNLASSMIVLSVTLLSVSLVCDLACLVGLHLGSSTEMHSSDRGTRAFRKSISWKTRTPEYGGSIGAKDDLPR